MNYHFLRQFTRQIGRNPLFYGLNLTGLALGIACAFILFSYVRQEWSYDRSIPGAEQIYRIGTDFMDMGGFAASQEILQPALEDRCQSVAYATRFKGGGELTLEVDQQVYPLDRVLYADTNFFQVFPYTFLEGQPQGALSTEDQIVLSEEIARQLFGDGPYLGKTLEINDGQQAFSVAGVVRPFAGKTHLPATVWLPVHPKLSGKRYWTSASFYNYVRLHPGAGRTDLEQFLDRLKREVIQPEEEPNTTYEEWAQSSRSVHFIVQPLKDIYLHSDLGLDLTTGGNPTQVWVLGIIGIFILLMAGVNYVNLNTAAAGNRAKEIGIKKTMGAGKRQLIFQFLGESLAVCFLAMLLAASFSGVLLQFLEKITGEVLLSSILDSPIQWLALLGFTLLTGLAAGAYPAFFLSRLQPVWTLKSDWVGHRKSLLRNGLVIFQFSIAAALMIGSVVIFRQLSYMRNTDKGFQHENVVVLRNFNDLGNKKETFRALLEKNSQVVSTSTNSRMPAGYQMWRTTYRSETMDQAISLNGFPVDEHYLPTMDIRLVAGRNFSGDLATDTSHVLVNESAVKALELKDPVGAVLNGNRLVIGVVSDFNFDSFRTQIAPVVFNYDQGGFNLAIKITGRDVPGIVAHLNESWKQLAGDQKIQYYFLDDNLAELSAKEAVLSRAIGIFTLLALFIACLGLFGLTTHATARRSKEIGVRKVLGASISQIVVLLSKDFLKLIAYAFLVGIPVAWFLSRQWLQGFVYRIDLSWWMFAGPALAGLLVAFFTLSYQSVSAARNNPVDVLKDE